MPNSNTFAPAAYPSMASPPPKPTPAPERVTRPPNAFIVFRSLYLKEQKTQAMLPAGGRQQDYSRVAADKWNTMSDAERHPYFEMADRMRAEHKVAYPNYRFAPGPKRSKSQPKPRHAAHAMPPHGHRIVAPDFAYAPRDSSWDSNSSPYNRIPTLSSAYQPPADDEAQKYEYAVSRTESPAPRVWDPTVTQFGFPTAPADDSFVAQHSSLLPPSGSHSTSPSKRRRVHPQTTQTPFYPDPTFGVPEWPTGLSQSNTPSGSTQNNYYSPY